MLKHATAHWGCNNTVRESALIVDSGERKKQHTHTHTHSLSLSLLHTHSLSLSLSLTPTHTDTHRLTHSHTHTHTHTHTHLNKGECVTDDEVGHPVDQHGQTDGRRPRALREQLGHDQPGDGTWSVYKTPVTDLVNNAVHQSLTTISLGMEPC